MIRFMILFMFLLVSAPVFAAESEAPLKDVIAALEKGYASFEDVQAVFSQKTVIASMKKEQLGNGTLLIKKSPSAAMFRFNYLKPKQQILSNGREVWFYQPENEQVIVSKSSDVFRGGNNIALSYLTGLGRVSKDFIASFGRDRVDRNGDYHLVLTPKSPTPLLVKLELTVSGDTVRRFLRDESLKGHFPVVSSVIYDAAGNETWIAYSNVRVNKGISDSVFNFTIPKGVQVIRQ